MSRGRLSFNGVLDCGGGGRGTMLLESSGWKLRAYALSVIRYLSHENSTHALISFHLASSSSREIISSRARSISFHLVESRALRIAIQIAIASNREIADSSRFHLARSRFISRDQRHLVISRDHLVLSRLSFSVTHTFLPKDNLVGVARSFQTTSTMKVRAQGEENPPPQTSTHLNQ